MRTTTNRLRTKFAGLNPGLTRGALIWIIAKQLGHQDHPLVRGFETRQRQRAFDLDYY